MFKTLQEKFQAAIKAEHEMAKEFFENRKELLAVLRDEKAAMEDCQAAREMLEFVIVCGYSVNE